MATSLAQQPQVVKKGLHNFIAEIRGCTNKEDEQKRVDKELANIRQKFTSGTALNGYQKTKYVWKLVYIAMLGYEVDFGHVEAINLLGSTKYSEKMCGYLAISVLLKSSDEMMTLVVNSIRNDLISPMDYAQTLALSCISNLGGKDIAEILSGDVQRVLIEPGRSPFVRKKAALCMLRMFRTHSEVINHEEWGPKLSGLLEDGNLGVVTSVLSLVIAFSQADVKSYLPLRSSVISLLSDVNAQKSVGPEHLYYSVPNPWLQVKLLRALQCYPFPDKESEAIRLNEVLHRILHKTELTKNVNRNNADHAILFEAINYIIQQGSNGDEGLRTQAINMLGKFISLKEPNLRYLGLEFMYRLAQLEGSTDLIKKHQPTVLFSLKDADVSVRKRALDLLFILCDSENAMEIVRELVNHLPSADLAIREEMVLKIAILAERFTKNLRWYVDTVLQLISISGHLVTDDIWHRVVQIVTNNDELQSYAAENLFQALEPKGIHETAVKVGSYILGEFGYLISQNPNRSPADQFNIINKHFGAVSNETKAIILTCYVKMANLYPEIVPLVRPVFEKLRTSVHSELQQRALEYMALPTVPGEILGHVLEKMPVYPADRENALVKRLKKKQLQQEEDPLGDKQKAGEDQEDAPARVTKQSSVSKKYGKFRERTSHDSLLKQQEADGEIDLLGLDDSGTKESAQRSAQMPGQTRGLDKDIIPKMLEWFKTLAIADSGVLFENDTLQIGIKQEFRGSQGRVMAFVGNRSKASLESFSMTVASGDYLRIAEQPAPSEIAGGQQYKHQVMVECMKPFVDTPSLEVKFTCQGVAHHYPLKLPVVASKFVEGVELNGNDFLQRWKALEGENREQQAVFAAKKDIDPAANKDLLVKGLHLSIVQDMENNENALSAVGTLRTGTADPQGNKISVGCLVRLDANPQAKAYRITVRAVHGAVSVALKNILQQQLAT